MIIDAIAARNTPIVPKGAGEKKLGQTDFLQLMSAQLRQQDPFNPTDNTQMVAQLAQFSSVTGISEINSSLKSIATQLGEQTRLLNDIRAANQPPTSGN